MNSETPHSSDSGKKSRKEVKPPLGAGKRIRAYFLAGVLITAPISITLYLAWIFVNFVDRQVTSLIPEAYNPNTYLPFSLPGLGLLIVFLAFTIIGALTAGFFGRFFMRISESVLARMPVIRSIYGAVKQIFETVLAQQSRAFREAVLVEYPRRGVWAIAFITGLTKGEVQKITEEECINIFIPTTPNPTSGFLLFVPRKELVPLSMTVEEALKMVISGGILTPPDRHPAGRLEIPTVPVDAHENTDALGERAAARAGANGGGNKDKDKVGVVP